MKTVLVRSAPLVLRVLGVLGGLLLGGLAVQAQAPARPDRPVIEDIIPQGNAHVASERVMEMLKSRPGSEYQQDLINEDVRALYNTHWFANINVQVEDLRNGKVNVHFLFSEFPGVVQEIVYLGAGHDKPEDLNTLTGLRKGFVMNPYLNKQACQTLVKYYNEKGRPFAHVDLLEGTQASDTRIVFNITEGPKVHIRTISFTGNHFVGGAVLNTHVSSNKAFLATFFGVYNAAEVDHDVQKLKEYYLAYGFHDVKVSRELEFSPDQQYVNVIFHIDEGARYRVVGSSVVGATEQFKAELEPIAHFEPGFYSEVENKKKIQEMKDWVGYQGIDAVIVAKEYWLDPKTHPGEVRVAYEIVQRQPALVGEIKIIGNDVTREHVIRNQLRIYPGQVLSYPDLRVSEANLARLGIFATKPEEGIRPTVTVLEPDNPESAYRDVLVTVQEDRTGSLMFGLGVNSDAGFTGSVVLNERNFDILRPPTSIDDFLSGRAFRGGGQEFRIEVVPGTQAQRYAISWKDPFVFDSPYSLKDDVYYYQRDYNEDIESRLGTRVTVGRRLNDKWTVSAGVRVEDVGIHNVSIFAPEDYQSVVGDNFLTGVRVGLSRDTRDSYLRATQGSQFTVGYEQVMGDFTFPKVDLDATKYFTVYKRADGSGRHVVALHTQVQYAGPDAPVFERYYAGGFQSLRGFAFRGVGPEINGFRVGGDFELLNSLEYQIPIKANDHLYAVTFVDSGTVESNVEIKDYRVTAGFGLRIVVPMLGPVPIALDCGFPIVKGPNDQQQVFSFWLGFFH